MTAQFEMEKVTKNTVRFTEVLVSEVDTPMVGTIYVPKATLKEIGWKEGMTISLTIEADSE